MRSTFSADRGCKTVTFLIGTGPTNLPYTICEFYSNCPSTIPNSYEVNVEPYGRVLTGRTVDVDCRRK